MYADAGCKEWEEIRPSDSPVGEASPLCDQARLNGWSTQGRFPALRATTSLTDLLEGRYWLIADSVDWRRELHGASSDPQPGPCKY